MIENKADEMLYYTDITYVNNNYVLSSNSEMAFVSVQIASNQI